MVLLLGETLSFPKKEIDFHQESQDSAKNAKYYFSADIDDEVSEVKSHRRELRYGVDVIGSFSYSDGFIFREVTYTADQGGYRIISDKMEHLPHQSDNSTFNVTENLNFTQVTPTKLPIQRLLKLKKVKK